MDTAGALADIRRAIEQIERVERDRDRPRSLATGTDVIAIPFYYAAHRDRSEITRRAFRHFRRAAEVTGARVIGLGSEGKVSRDLWCETFDEVDYHEYPQCWRQPVSGAGSDGLRAKFDETVRRARVHDPARVFIGGSDDLIPLGWWEKAWASTADLVGVSGGAWIVNYRPPPARCAIDEWDGRYPHAPDIEFCGGGVVLSRDLLEAWGWAPFDAAGDEIRIERRAREESWRVEAIPGRFHAVKVRGAVLNEPGRARRVGAHAIPGVEQAEVAEEWRATWEGLA